MTETPEDPLPVPPLLPPPHAMKAKSRHARRVRATALSKRPREFPWETVCPAVFNITRREALVSQPSIPTLFRILYRIDTLREAPTDRESIAFGARRQHGAQEVHSIY